MAENTDIGRAVFICHSFLVYRGCTKRYRMCYNEGFDGSLKEHTNRLCCMQESKDESDAKIYEFMIHLSLCSPRCCKYTMLRVIILSV